MDKETRIAVEESIEHWKQNTAAETPDEASAYSDACALCVKFSEGAVNPCDGCPVAEKTGRTGCHGSPWEQAFDALETWRYYGGGSPYSEAGMKHRRDKFRAAATEELEFLKSLLPKDETSCED